MNDLFIEVRVPTFKRPDLLRRALKCLLNQTWTSWKVVVFDDSSDKEAQGAVAEIGDARIQYRSNSYRLGAAGNLNQCFQRPSMAGGKYAFVLEDDNGLKPDFIEANVSALRKSGLNLLLREQEMYDETESGGWQPTGLKTKDRLYQKTGVFSARYVQGSIFFNDAIANSGLFWDTENCRSNLVVGECVKDSGLQEFCRTVQIVEPILYCEEPLSIWTRASKNQSVRSFVNNRIFGRGVQALQQRLLDLHGSTLKSSLWQTALLLDMETLLRKNLAALASPRHSIFLQHDSETLLLMCKGLAKRLFVSNVLSEYLHSSQFLGLSETAIEQREKF